MMTRKNYRDIAEVISGNHPVQGEAVDIQYLDLTYALADVMAEDNPRFDRDAFLKAAGF